RAQLVLARCERALALLDLRQPLHRRRQLCLAPRERGDALVDRVLARDELGLAHLETLQALEPDPKLRLAALELHLRLTDRAFALLQLRELCEAALHLGLRALQLGLRLRERALLLCDRRLALGELRRRLDARRLALPDLLDAELECVLALGEARLRVAQPGVLLGDASAQRLRFGELLRRRPLARCDCRLARCELRRPLVELVRPAGRLLLDLERLDGLGGKLRPQVALSIECGRQLCAQLRHALRVQRRSRDRLADGNRRVLGGPLLRLGCPAVLLALELGAETGAESSFSRVGHQKPKSLERLMRAGPRTTMNIAGKMKTTVGKSILIGAFIACSSAAAWRLSRESTACTRRMRPSEMPSWSAWMIARTKAASSGESTRAESFFSASCRASPTRISVSASANSSMSGPAMWSVSFEMAASNPSPASTLTASRSSASGSCACTSSRRRRARALTTNPGAIQPIAARTSTMNTPADLCVAATRTKPKRPPTPASTPFAARKL